MKRLMTCIAMIMAIVLISCDGRNNETASDAELAPLANSKSEEQKTISNGVTADSAFSSAQVATSDVINPGQPAPNIDWDKKMVKTANLKLEVKDFKVFNTGIHDNIKRFGAYIANEQQSELDGKLENVVTIKVPVVAFDDLVNALQPEGVKVHEKRITAEDVTGEVVDTKARIEARKQVRDQYLSLLKKAKNMKEILQVQTEIDGIQEEIEAGTGRTKYLSTQAAYSTINLTYFQYLESAVKPDDNTLSFGAKLKEALETGASFFSGLLIVIATIWPVFLVAFCVWFISKKYPGKQVKLVKREE